MFEMNRVLIGAIAGSAIVILFALIVWRKWIAPWRKFQELIEQIVQGEKPSTFLVGGGVKSRRAGLALEELFNRHRQLAQQLVGRVAEAETILGAMQDGLLVVDANRHVLLVNRTFRELFGLDQIPVGAPVLDVIRKPELDRLIAEALHTGVGRDSDAASAIVR